MFKVGRVTHYYDKIGVAIVELDNILVVGDKVKFVKDGNDIFEQRVESIQIGHEKKTSAKAGEMVGLKTEQVVDEGNEIFKG